MNDLQTIPADRTIHLQNADEIMKHAHNMAAIIGRAMLTQHGFYACTIDGEKVLFLIGGEK